MVASVLLVAEACFRVEEVGARYRVGLGTAKLLLDQGVVELHTILEEVLVAA